MSEAKAFVDATGGRAIVIEEDGRIFVLDVNISNTFQDGKGIHFGMYLQPGMTDIETRPAGVYPYEEIVRYVELEYRRNRTLQIFCLALDGSHTLELRQMSGECAEELLADDQVYEWLKEGMLKVPMPESADTNNGITDGRVGEILAAMVEKWRKPIHKQK